MPKRTYIREVVHHIGCPSLCSIRTDTYAHSVAHFVRMAEVAQADVCGLAFDDIAAVVYGGNRIKRTRGIEFRVPREFVPDTYVVRRELENHL